ncbi:MAG: hypothetical protein F6K58_19875 [Symploca sp. SIO2E9]|nr:hypothetical protein [Symploca sp. SIO2E9]
MILTQQIELANQAIAELEGQLQKAQEELSKLQFTQERTKTFFEEARSLKESLPGDVFKLVQKELEALFSKTSEHGVEPAPEVELSLEVEQALREEIDEVGMPQKPESEPSTVADLGDDLIEGDRVKILEGRHAGEVFTFEKYETNSKDLARLRKPNNGVWIEARRDGIGQC